MVPFPKLSFLYLKLSKKFMSILKRSTYCKGSLHYYYSVCNFQDFFFNLKQRLLATFIQI